MTEIIHPTRRTKHFRKPSDNAIAAPGLYEISAERYHSDPCEVPSLSCSIARALVRQSPGHAYYLHARGGGGELEATRTMDDGSAVHAMMAGRADMIMTLRSVYGPKTKNKDLIGKPVLDFKTADAQDERDEIRGMGKIPLLQQRMIELTRCYRAAVKQLRSAQDGAVFLSPGRSEITAVSCEDEVWLRALVDRLPDDQGLGPGDFKFTEMSAAPGGWERRLIHEYAFQDAFYARVLAGAEGFLRPPMRFCVVELKPPHGTVIMGAMPALRAVAEAEVERAIRRWRQCMATGLWPLYPPHTALVDAPPWLINQMEETEYRERTMETEKYDPYSLADHPFPFA